MTYPSLNVVGLTLMSTTAVFAQSPPPTYAQTGSPLAPAATNAAPTPPSPGPATEVVLQAAQAALEACHKIEQQIAVTILDAGGIPKIVLASDGASPRGVQSSTNKALTALQFKTATSELAERAKSDAGLQARLSANAVYNTRAGGLPLLQGMTLLGAVGVGGAKGSEKDEQCAHAALEVLQRAIKGR